MQKDSAERPSYNPVTTVDGNGHLNFDWGSIKWLCDEKMYPSAGITFGFVQIDPKTKNTKHFHPNCDEVLYLLEGELRHSLGSDVHEIKPGMAIFIPANVEHDALNVSNETAKMIVAYSEGDRQTVMCEEGDE